ncbi:hypothetical protein BGZ72_001926 [Mortierella alpina]|nr:hypothetical protein BGZ72_001926 [Mortierella alpina]
MKQEVMADSSSSASTIQEQAYNFPATGTTDHDPTATPPSPLHSNTKTEAEADSLRTPGATTPVVAHQGYWKQRFMIRPHFEGDPRVELSRFRKAVILCIISQAGCLGGFSSTIYIEQDLNTSTTAINASVSLFILFMGISPLVSSTLSDYFKIRRVLYIGSTLIFALASLGGGYSSSVATLTIARVFQAVGSGGASILGAGTVADIYPPEEQGTSMGLMFLGQFLGPVLGPPIGGVLAEAFGWQATFFFMAIVSAVVIVELFFLLPETYREDPKDALEELEAKGEASEKVEPAKKKRFNPFQSVLLLRHTVFYGLSETQVGLTYLGAGAGSVLGSVLGGKMSDLSLMRAQRKNGGDLVLEDRLSLNMWLAGFAIVPLGALMFGWGAQEHLSIAVPIVGFAIYNFGMAQVMAAGSAYLVNAIPGQGSSATAAANFMRMVLACIFSLIAQIIVDHVGYGYYGVLQAALNIFCMALFYLVRLKGASMRATAARKELALSQ